MSAYADVYDGAATLGRIVATVTLIICCIVGPVMIAVGLYMIFKGHKKVAVSTSAVPKMTAPTAQSSETAQPSKTAQPSATASSDPVTANEKGRRTAGVILLVVGLVSMICAIVNYLLTVRFKVFAAASGMESVFDF